MNGTTAGKTEMSFGVGADARLTVNTDEGQVRVRGADVDAIHVHVRDYDPEEYEWNDPLIVDADGSNIRLTQNTGAGIDELHLEITVPRDCSVSVTALGADVTVESVHGAVMLHTTDGEIKVREVSGSTNLNSTGGDIRLETLSGDSQVISSEGDIQGRWVAGTVRLNAANGDVRVLESQIRSATVEAANGEITVQTSLSPEGTYRLHSANGDSHLMVDPGSGATVRMQTNEGDIRPDVQADNVKRTKRTWEGTIGDGGASVIIESANGDVRISERGQHPSPAMIRVTHAGHPMPPTPSLPPMPPIPPMAPIPPIPPIPPIAPFEHVPHDAESIAAAEPGAATTGKSDETIAILARLERGEISVEEAMKSLDTLN